MCGVGGWRKPITHWNEIIIGTEMHTVIQAVQNAEWIQQSSSYTGCTQFTQSKVRIKLTSYALGNVTKTKSFGSFDGIKKRLCWGSLRNRSWVWT